MLLTKKKKKRFAKVVAVKCTGEDLKSKTRQVIPLAFSFSFFLFFNHTTQFLPTYNFWRENYQCHKIKALNSRFKISPSLLL